MNNRFYPTIFLLLFSLMSFNSCAQESINHIDSFDVETNSFFEFNEDVKPVFQKAISENKHCFHATHNGKIYTSSITDEHVDGEYKNKLYIKSLDSLGNVIWVYTFEDFRQQQLTDFHPVDDGVYVLYEGYTGRFERACYLTKLNSDGELLWTHNFGKMYGTDFRDLMKLDENGNLLFVTQHFENSFIHRFSPDGNVIASAWFTDKSGLNIMDFDMDESGNVFLIGHISSYPEKIATQEIFFYKLNPEFKILKKKVISLGRMSIGNSIKYIGNDNFAIHISADIDYNKNMNERITSYFAKLDANLNVSNVTTYNTGNSSHRQHFKSITDEHVFALTKIRLNKSNYHAYHKFDKEMNYIQSCLINFNTGIMDGSVLSDGRLLFNKFSEEVIILDGKEMKLF